jgi:hypothetical protein
VRKLLNPQEKFLGLGSRSETESSIRVNEGEPNSLSLSITYQGEVFQFFIQKIIVSCRGEECGEVRSFPIADAGAETPLS